MEYFCAGRGVSDGQKLTRTPPLHILPIGLNSTLLPLKLAPGKRGESWLNRLSMPANTSNLPTAPTEGSPAGVLGGAGRIDRDQFVHKAGQNVHAQRVVLADRLEIVDLQIDPVRDQLVHALNRVEGCRGARQHYCG